MMVAKNDPGAAMAASSREFTLTRTFDAPRDMVWKALIDPEQLAQWWGPKGFIMLSCKVDLRPGGLCHYGMRAPNGMEMWGKFVYREIVPQERLAYVVAFSDKDGGTTRHFASPTWPLEILTTIRFVEQNGKTTLVMTGVPINATEEERKTFDAGFESMRQGFKGTLDQLDDYLAGCRNAELKAAADTATDTAERDRELLSTRTFDAPRELVFKAWIDPDHLKQWWGPEGFTNTFHEFDPKPGGVWIFVMHGPDGVDYPNHNVFVEIVNPERIVFDHVSDPKFRATIRFEDLDGRTRIMWRMLFETAAAFDKIKGLALAGNKQTLDRLEALLAKR